MTATVCRNACVFVSATLAAFTLFGYGPRDASSTGQQAASPTLEVKSQPTGQKSESPTVPDWPNVKYLPADAARLVGEWESNSSAASARYNGKPNGVEFVAVLDVVMVNDGNQTTAKMHPKGSPEKVLYVAASAEGSRDGLNVFKVGDVVRVKAVASPYSTASAYFAAYRFLPE